MRWIGTWVWAAACAGATTTPSTTGETGPAAPTQDEVQAAIDAANHCTDPSGCTDLGAQCPFGCWILVSVDEADAVQATIDAYLAAGGSTCTYSCANRGEIECRSGKCEADPVY